MPFHTATAWCSLAVAAQPDISSRCSLFLRTSAACNSCGNRRGSAWGHEWAGQHPWQVCGLHNSQLATRVWSLAGLWPRGKLASAPPPRARLLPPVPAP